MNKKILKIILIVAVPILCLLYFVTTNKLYRNIKDNIPYEYKLVCTNDYCDIIDSLDDNKYNIFSLLNKKNRIKNMFNANTIFKNNGLTSITYVFTKNDDGEFLTKEKGYIDCIVDYLYQDGTIVTDYDAKIKIRGNSTATLDKKPYCIKFSDSIDLINAGESKKWNFLAESLDPSFMRNRIFLKLGNDVGLDYTTKTEYTELYIDYKYYGCYLITEAIESGKSRINIDINNGDFMFEYERERVEDNAKYIVTTNGIRFSINEPEDIDEDKFNEISNEIGIFDDALFSGDYAKVSNLFDIDSFVKYYFVNEFAKTKDFDYSSVKFYKKGDKYYAGPLWDFDQSAGNARPFEGIGYWSNIAYDIYQGESYSGLWCRENNPIFKQLFTYDEFNEEYVNYYYRNVDLLENIFKENGLIDSEYLLYKDIFDKNFLSKDNGGAGWDPSFCELHVDVFNTQEEQIKYLISWLKHRYKWLNDNVK